MGVFPLAKQPHSSFETSINHSILSVDAGYTGAAAADIVYRGDEELVLCL